MSNAFRSQISEVMCLAWQMVKRNGYSMSEALKTAWMNIKLKAAMKERIVKFYFQKVDGSIREAYGTLKDSLLPDSKGTDSRKKSDTVQTYFDTERGEFRCFKKANLIKIG
ncbi:SH3 beta-barrel fold-containing protein [Bacteroides eggerthii]|uniref:SH3 beta-barrel fold-containing protein n=1 Tax=Bacteroides eggerthii TaxID=28111 RepID=UPI0022E55C56|nr:SH3 beta-barrel fold-containing protein [Bacteroides eggerthii]